MANVNTSSTAEVATTSKLTLEGTIDSPDPDTTFAWAVASRTGLTLVHKETTLTSISAGDRLVVKAGVMTGGEAYSFRLTATNSHGATGFDILNVTANRPPWNGMMSVSPEQGTTLRDEFVLKTSNWTDDASSLPLMFSFVYYLKSGDSTYIRVAARPPNVTTFLPLGHSGGFNNTELPVSTFAQDLFGSIAAVTTSVRVLAPSLRTSTEHVLNQTSAIEDLADSGETAAALVMIQAASDLLNVVFGAGNDEQAAEAAEARSEYLDLTLKVRVAVELYLKFVG